MKEVADFKVFTKGAGSGELKVTVKGPSECHGRGLEGWGRQGGRWGPGGAGKNVASGSYSLRALRVITTPPHPGETSKRP